MTEKHRVRRMQMLIDQLILTAGAWQSSGGTDKLMERQFGGLLKRLSKVAKVSTEDALELLMAHLGESEEQAC